MSDYGVDPSTLAIRYLMNQWTRKHGELTPPLDLARAVVNTVSAIGYNKPVINKLILNYEMALEKQNSCIP